VKLRNISKCRIAENLKVKNSILLILLLKIRKEFDVIVSLGIDTFFY